MKEESKKEDWFKLKRYPHIGYPITEKDRKKVVSYIKEQDSVRKHSFLPFLHKTIIQRKFRAHSDNEVKTPTGKRLRTKEEMKRREIHFASHLDSLIFSYYNSILSKEYEKILKNAPFNKSVVAYRKIPIETASKSHKCNIDFAKAAFKFIQDNSDQNLTVIVADVTKFFNNLDHKILKKQWAKTLGRVNLPPDHYNVYKALTNLRLVEEDQIFEYYKDRVIVKKGIPNHSKKKEYRRAEVKKKSLLKEKEAVAFCTKEEFLKNNLNLIISEKKNKGIIQGSPISATLANIYMLDFDKIMDQQISEFGGFYQRYSDDLVLVCSREHEDFFLKFLRSQMNDLVKLEVHPKKTKVYHFEKREEKINGFLVDEKTKKKNLNKNLEYLGFEFDGNRVLIKTAGFSKFYRSMKRSFKRSASLAIHSRNPDRRLFKTRLYKRFTYRGAQRKMIYRPSSSDPKKYIRTEEQYWGNYISYVEKANYTMESINRSPVIKKQGRRLWHQFHKLRRQHEERIALAIKYKEEKIRGH